MEGSARGLAGRLFRPAEAGRGSIGVGVEVTVLALKRRLGEAKRVLCASGTK